MAIPATQIRRGMVIVFEGDPARIIEFRHHTPGNLRAMVQAKLKNLRTGSNFEHRFRACAERMGSSAPPERNILSAADQGMGIIAWRLAVPCPDFFRPTIRIP